MAVHIGTEKAKRALKDEHLERDLLEDELDDDVPAHIREARMDAFRKEMEELKLAKEAGNGQLMEIEDEKKLFEITTSQSRVICHFFHPDFRRCALMNQHLRDIATRHFTTKFVYLNAEKAPFLLQRLKVKELPTLLCFVDSVVKDRLVGFEELGNSDGFNTKTLEGRLARTGVISLGESSLAKQRPARLGVFGAQRRRKANRRVANDDSDAGDSDSDSDSD